MDISNYKIVIATHSLVYGAPQALYDYLKQKKADVLFVEKPLFGNPLSWSVGMIDTFLKVSIRDGRIDLYVGVDPLNAIVGVILKKMGKVEKLIYYTIDYMPKRFNNPLLDKIYHFLDKQCLANADETWNVSPRIAPAREKYHGLIQSLYNHQKVVPIGIWFDKVKRLPFNKIKRHQLLFLGHLMESAGIQLVLESIPEIVKKIPDFHFLVIGGGEYEKNLKKMSKQLKIEKYITFTGWVKDRNKLDRLMADSAAALALYDRRTSKTTQFSDPTKLKDYLSAGLPVILTDLPHNANDIEKKQCGIIVKYDTKSVTVAIIKLLSDIKTLEKFKKNAVAYIKQFDWNNIFEKNLRRLLG